jgi:hypothetical protein
MRSSVDSSGFLPAGGVGELIRCFQASAGHGVGAALVERMAPAKALQSEPDALRRPVDFDGLPHVFRTGRVEAAGGREEWRNQELISPEEESKALTDAL